MNNDDINEQDLLAELRLGNERAFRLLYDRYSRSIYGNILKLVRNEEVADDLLQDVFTKIWEHREHIEPHLSFRAYLFICSRHFVFNFQRRLKLEMETAMQMAAEYDDVDDAVTDLLHAKEAKALMEAAVNQLPSQRQRVFRLCKLDGLSYQEVAHILGISVATVRDHMVKANKSIREWLLQNGGLTTVLLIGVCVSFS